MSQSRFSFTGGEAIIADLRTGTGLTLVPLSQGSQMVLMQFGASGATTADSGVSSTASYSGADLGTKPTRGMMTFSLTAGAAASGSAVLIANPNGLNTVANVTDGSMHLVFTENYVNVGTFSGGVLTNSQHFYGFTLTKDGTTKYRAGFKLTPTDITIYMPDGSAVTITSASYYNAAGRYCQFESFTGSALGTRATFYAVGFEAA